MQMCPVGNYLIAFGKESNHYCRKRNHAIEVVARGKKNIGGRPPADRRKTMAGNLYILRTSCQWNATPKEYGSGKTLHRYFQYWSRCGVFNGNKLIPYIVFFGSL